MPSIHKPENPYHIMTTHFVAEINHLTNQYIIYTHVCVCVCVCAGLHDTNTYMYTHAGYQTYGCLRSFGIGSFLTLGTMHHGAFDSFYG